MSRHNFIRKKGTNNNKPYKQFRRKYSDEDDSLPLKTKDKSFSNEEKMGYVKMNTELQESEVRNYPKVKVERTGLRPPPGLKGKALGLWYRDHYTRREQEVVTVEIDNDTKQEVKNVLSTYRCMPFNLGEGSARKANFNSTFLNKINITFEEKLENTPFVKITHDEKLDSEMYIDYLTKKDNKSYLSHLNFRKKLPSYNKKKEILDLISHNQIILISGATGCGKTTQVVQYVLDDYIQNKNGSLFTAICTQPRRISTVMVSERVAAERVEHIGESVGYLIRLESKLPKRNRGTITFVTTGVLIQWLQSDPTLCGISHLFIDEVHERNTLCDFLLALLKYILPKRPDLRVILMSATLNAEKFSDYFGGIPCLEIPGFTYPVEELYLEDILEKVNFKFANSPGMKNMPLDEVFRSHVVPYVKKLEESGKYSKSILQELRDPKSEKLDVDFMAAVVNYIFLNEPEGAILVFVPGLSTIQDLHKTLMKHRHFASSRALIIPLHSIMSTVNQRDAFRRPPSGVRKIIIATSIAETSITIDDVVYVIDTGRHKMTNFDILKNVVTLEPEWETLANANQRKGRAGRTQPGKCFKLFTKAREMTFEPFPPPEIQRTRLEEVILNAKTLQLGQVGPFLEKVIDPPNVQAVELSLKMLRTINAIDIEERLTPLGFHLAKLPIDPQTGKMILMGALFGCLDPILSIAACLSFKDPFFIVLNKEDLVDQKRKNFSRGELSDHYMLSEVLRIWEEQYERGSGSNFAYANFLSNNNLMLLKNMKLQFASHLKKMNFLIDDNPKNPCHNFNSHNIDLIKAVVCSGLYPNVAVIKKKNRMGMPVVLGTIDHPSVKFHAKSVLKGQKGFCSPYIVYFEKIKSTSIFLYDATMVHPMALLFFGEKLEIVKEGSGYFICVDEMIKVSCHKETAHLVQELRRRLQLILESSVSNPEAVNWKKYDPKTVILSTIIKLFQFENRNYLLYRESTTSKKDM